MIAHMTPTDAQKALNRQNANGWTPLLIASHKGIYLILSLKIEN